MKKQLLKYLQEEKEMQLKGGIYHKTQVGLAYNSNRIEGSKLSEEQTRCIYETNTILNNTDEPIIVDDIVETMNHFKCFDFMLDCAEEDLNEGMIKEFHRILKSGTSDEKKGWFMVGDYKLRPNIVGNKETTKPSEVEVEVKKLIAEYISKQGVQLKDIVDFHYQFECIHPFQDGNVPSRHLLRTA